MSRVLREATYLNVPIIATRITGTTDALQHNKDASLYEPGNVELLQETLRRAIRNPEARHSLTINAQQTFKENFTHFAFSNSLRAIIESA